MSYPQLNRRVSALFLLVAAFALLHGPTAIAHEVTDATTCPGEPTQPPDDALTGAVPDIGITELLPDPIGTDADSEFIEIGNRGDAAASLDGWMLKDGKARTAPLDGLTIEGHAFRYLLLAETGIPLVNTGGSVSLVAPDGTVTMTVTYADAPEGSAYARTAAGTWEWTTVPTPGAENVFGSPVPPAPAPTTAPDGYDAMTSPDTDDADGAPRADLSAIVLSEIFPDPAGTDDEWIELQNPGSMDVELAGAVIDDADGGSVPYILPAGSVIPAGGFLVIGKAASHIALNNGGDDVRLFDGTGTLIDSVSYGAAVEAMSFARNSKGWSWTDAPTPGGPNIEPSEGPSPGPEDPGSTDPEDVIAPPDDTGDGEGPDSPDTRTDIADLYALDAGTTVSIEAAVSAPPGVLGKTLFGLQDGDEAVVARIYGAEIPDLQAGERVRVTGKIAQANGAVRIHTSAQGIMRLGDGIAQAAPTDRMIAELTRDDEGMSVRIEGVVTDVRTRWFMMSDDAARHEAKIVLGDGWPQTSIVSGAQVSVVGIVKITGELTLVLPLFRDAIAATATSDETSADAEDGGQDAGPPRDPFILLDQEEKPGIMPLVGAAGVVTAGGTLAVLRRRRGTADDVSS